MSLPRLYNTLTRTVDELAPRTPGKASVYCCGPTVYDVPHAGHARPAVAFDVLVRHLRGKGLDVTYVRNITDVDDKILDRAKALGEVPTELSARMSELYERAYSAVGCETPDHRPKVSEHIAAIIELIQRLIERDAAYVVDRPDATRDVYFAVRSFPEYGKLSRRRIDELRVGARIEKDEAKRDPLDFALWKGAAVGEWGVDSPWGHGRPGWHIECSAMCSQYLGHGFDIHCGGMDLIFPHHENEIAQSEAARPGEGPLAHVWMHNGFINVDKEKMSKSLGNFVTIDDVLARNDGEAFRWYLLTVHYRGPIQFDTEKLANGRVIFPGVDDAEKRVDYIYRVLTRLRELEAHGGTAPGRLPPELVAFRDTSNQAAREATAALDDDLNTPVALAALGEMARSGNELCDLADKRRKDPAFGAAAAQVAGEILAHVTALCSVLGLAQAPAEVYAARTRERRLRLRNLSIEGVDTRVKARTEARRNKDFARADAIRNELFAEGIVLKDSPDGTVWHVEP
jgi:cysteinyl-tRNA synthetase